MYMIPSANDFYSILPLIIIGSGILISLCIEMFSKNNKVFVPWFSVVLFIFTAYYSLLTISDQQLLFNAMVASGGNVHIFYFIFNFGAAIVVLLSISNLNKYNINMGEFYILLQSSVLGMMMIASAKDLIMIFIGLEQMSVSFYILAGFNRKRVTSNEAALKYFLLGAFATGFIVYGMALIYGSAQTLSYGIIAANFSTLSSSIIFITGMLLFIIGFAFKIAAFPFHMWVPDVYQGSPTTVTAIMSTGGKTAAFSALLIVMTPFLSSLNTNLFSPFLSILAVCSMLFGSIVAIMQNDIKRMLAYSSIAHAGYMLIGLAAGNQTGFAGIIFYLAAYTFMNLAAFGIVAILEKENGDNLQIEDLNGLGSKSPTLAALLSLSMFALSGIPPFAGFFGKYYVFMSAIQANLTWLAIVGVVSSAISVYFYLRLTVVMYFKDGKFEEERKTIPGSALLGVAISSLLIIAMGVMPQSIIELISTFIR